MNNLENVLAEYHKYLMLRKLAKAEHAGIPRSVGQGVSPVRQGQNRPQIRGSGFTAKERIERKERNWHDCR